ncbi:MAG: UDP-N-acetylmuramate dehydrogenase [Patescibacteria group bacterium]
MKIQENISLRPFTTFRIGGAARFFAEPRSEKELANVIEWAQKHSSRIFVLGGGSNILIPDSDFDGLIIRLDFKGIKVHETTVIAGASVLLDDVISKTLKAGLVGLELAAGIPGTIGGAVRGNAGTFGENIGDRIASVSYFSQGAMHTLDRSACDFKYRDSIFKRSSFIITSCTLELPRGDTKSSKHIIDDRKRVRRESHPLEPSAGCIFKNVEFARIDIEELAKRDIDISRFEKFKKIPSGYLIESLGLKGKKIGGAQVSEKHGNYIINTGAATFEDVIMLVSYIKQQVRDAYNIQLDEEVQILQ